MFRRLPISLLKVLGVQLSVKSYEEIPMVECNEKQIKQALLNIIKNAIESLTNGGTVELSYSRTGGDKVSIIIKDNGCGIDADRLNQLFQPFYTTKQEGTGMGLLITKKIIEDHQGEINFKSKKGEGTTVEIVLPFNIHNDNRRKACSLMSMLFVWIIVDYFLTPR